MAERRLIDANALMDAFRNYMAERHDWEKCVSEENCEACEFGCLWRRIVKNAPAADVEPVKWIPIIGFEGLYEVNQWGQIRNKDGMIMRQRLKRDKYTVYKKVSLYKNGKYEHLYVHRLVAQAFLPNPNNFELVNHKDEDGTNNIADNLEWCDRSYNASYGSAPKKLSKAHTGKVLSEEHKLKISEGLKSYYSTHEVWNKACPNCGAKMEG